MKVLILEDSKLAIQRIIEYMPQGTNYSIVSNEKSFIEHVNSEPKADVYFLDDNKKPLDSLFENERNILSPAIVDDDGSYLEVKKAASDFLEDEKEEIIKKKVWDYAPPGTLEKQKKITHLSFPDVLLKQNIT